MSWGLTSLVVINWLVTLYLWDALRRGPKRKFLKKLLYGEPITPKHNPPPTLDGLPFVDEYQRQFFADFDMFAHAVNRFNGAPEFPELRAPSPWRLEELPDRELRGYYDGPQYGRRYKIFYNQVWVGSLQIHPFYGYAPTNPHIRTEMKLEFARLLPFRQIEQLVSSIACPSEFESADKNIFSALHAVALRQLWRIEYDKDLDDRSSGGSITLQFDGSAEGYLKWRDMQHAEQSAA